MKRSGIISLLTDFGIRDGYVAAMKGVILSVNPAARLVDISHEVEPQDVQAGAFLLSHHARFFPEGTVHLAVVDPGVGSGRRLLAVDAGAQAYVAPDNGLLDCCLDLGSTRAVELTESKWWRQPVCPTFHGRDILAPVTAHLSTGLSLNDFGRIINLVRRLPTRQCLAMASEVRGEVVYVDRFGNLVTNIPGRTLAELSAGGEVEISVDRHVIGPVQNTYAAVAGGKVVALVGGFGLLEIGVNRGSAARHLAAGVGASVRACKKS